MTDDYRPNDLSAPNAGAVPPGPPQAGVSPDSPASAPRANLTLGPNGAPFATFGQRVGGFFLDGIISAVPFIPAFIAFALSDVSGFFAVVGLILGLVAFAFVAYVWFWLPGITGQTPAKRIIGTEILDASNGSYIGGGRAVLRNFIGSYANSIPCYLGYLWPLWDNQKQTFADKIAKSVVVQGNKGGLLPIFPDGKPF